MNKRVFIKFIFHILFWVGWLLFFHKITVLEVVQDVEILDQNHAIIKDNVENSYVDAFPLILAGIFFKAICCYIIIFVVKRAFLNHNKLFLVLSGLGVFALFFFIENVVSKTIIMNSSMYRPIHLELWNNSNYLQYFILLVLLIAYIVIEELIVLDKKYLDAEREKLRSELSFLKYQLNPHLLFNTLNNLFSMSQAHEAQDVSDGILKLSGIMRYMLYENKDARILLTREIEFLKQYSDLQKLRFSDISKPQINFSINGDITGIKIPSFILIPFVENAFKHGMNPRKESFVDINLEVLNSKLLFEVTNTIHRTQEDVGNYEGGIGIKNLKKRLELLYPNNHRLNQYEKNEIYYSSLEIKLNEK